MKVIEIRKHKWIIHWSAFGLLVSLFVFTAIYFEGKTWVGNVLQTIGTVAGIYLTIIIFLFSKESSDQQFSEQLEHLQSLNAKHIEALQGSTERHIDSLSENTNKQIIAINEATNRQIENYAKQTSELLTHLKDHSLILAELLRMELNDALSYADQQLSASKNTLQKVKEWTLLRNPIQKASQIKKQTKMVEDWESYKDWLTKKQYQVNQFLTRFNA